MKRLVAFILGLCATTTLLGADSDGKRWWSHVEALANDQMQGRNTGSPEHRRPPNMWHRNSNVQDSSPRAHEVTPKL